VTNIDNLGSEILDQLKQYGQLVNGQIELASEQTAKDLVDDLKRESPKRAKRGGKYAKGWKVKKLGTNYIVYNRTKYQLTHLLEHGHAKRGGGRVPAKVHIRPAEERAVNTFIRRIEDAIRS
jgi:hypothetical protein